MRYVLDTCVINKAWKVWYPPEFAQCVWSTLEDWVRNGQAVILDVVRDELMAEKGEMMNWVDQRKDWFRQVDTATYHQLRELLARHPGLVPKRETNPADPYLIAWAVAHSPDVAVVSDELPTGGAMQIPKICACYNVPCLSLARVFQREGITVQFTRQGSFAEI